MNYQGFATLSALKQTKRESSQFPVYVFAADYGDAPGASQRTSSMEVD
jgi:hypothetical protein